MSLDNQRRLDIVKHQPRLRDVCGEAFTHSFMKDLVELLKRKEWNVYKWLHQPFASSEGPSGADLWANIVEFGHLQNYTLPRLEADLVRNSQTILRAALGPLKPFVLMAGAGTIWSVLNKEIPTLEAVNASAAADWDLCSSMAYKAIDCVQQKLGIRAVPFIKDFSEPLNELYQEAGDRPILVTMFGCTLGNDVNLETIPDCLSRVIKQRGFLWVTMDNAVGEEALLGYQGSLYQSFQNNYWTFAKQLAEDDQFDDMAFRSCPLYVDKTQSSGDLNYSAVLHRHIVTHDTCLTINDTRYELQKGTVFNIGCSQKWQPEDVRETFEQAGWRQLYVVKEGTISAVLYAACDTPRAWLKTVQQALKA